MSIFIQWFISDNNCIQFNRYNTAPETNLSILTGDLFVLNSRKKYLVYFLCYFQYCCAACILISGKKSTRSFVSIFCPTALVDEPLFPFHRDKNHVLHTFTRWLVATIDMQNCMHTKGCRNAEIPFYRMRGVFRSYRSIMSIQGRWASKYAINVPSKYSCTRVCLRWVRGIAAHLKRYCSSRLYLVMEHPNFYYSILNILSDASVPDKIMNEYWVLERWLLAPCCILS